MKKAFMWIAIAGIGCMAISAIGKSKADRRIARAEQCLDEELESFKILIANAATDDTREEIRREAFAVMEQALKGLSIKQQVYLRAVYTAKINAM